MDTRRIGKWSAAVAMLAAVVACTISNPRRVEMHRWWSGFGLVVPHESLPADCSLCHVGSSWNKLVEDFRFDHGARTGVVLNGVSAGVPMVPPRDAPAMAVAALDVLDDPSAGDRAKARFASALTWSAIAARKSRAYAGGVPEPPY